MVKSIDEHFFDVEGKSNEQLKTIYYVLGAFYSGYRADGDKGFEFRTKSKELAEIVKNELSFPYDIVSNEGVSFSLVKTNTPYLRNSLESLGLHPNKKNREFPDNIESKYLPHFIRGAFDSMAYFDLEGHGFVSLSYANPFFLKEMNDRLIEHAGIQRKSINNGKIKYSRKDAQRIHNFIYSDWEFIEPKGLYLPANKDLLSILSNRNKSHYETALSSFKMEMAKRLLPNKQASSVAIKLGYSSIHTLRQRFRILTNMTPTEYQKSTNSYVHHNTFRSSNSIALAVDFIKSGKSVKDAARLAGFKRPSSLSFAFKKRLGMTITDFKKMTARKNNIFTINIHKGGGTSIGRREYFCD